ncbi:MAG: hypothetical protein MZU97_20105 [Bacillus subtilis]|nr:hypothetical protein [Bacillus subtilis]
MTTKINRARLRKWVFGRRGNDGILFKTVLYVLLIGISFIFLYPLLSMLSMSLMTIEDLIDSTIAWIPRELTFQNYAVAFRTINFETTFRRVARSIVVADDRDRRVLGLDWIRPCPL